MWSDSGLLGISLLALPYLAKGYSLATDYTGNNYTDFFGKFTFWTDADPTNGYVEYVSQDDAWADGLIGNGGNIYLGVDTTNTASGSGRKSVRLTSSDTYNPGTLFVADIAHMPETCGTWPAWWMTSSSSDWPQEGEIDVVENANNAQNNQMSLHVSNAQGQCQIDQNADMTATKDRWGDCNEEDTEGCDANNPRTSSFGSGFNDNNGGVYAMEWTADHVQIWFFPRDSIPDGSSGPLGNSPDPTAWGTPTTAFDSQDGTGCDMSEHIKNQRIVIDTTFCGTWASGTWDSSGCASSTGYDSCEDYVQNKPSDFVSAFWTFNSMRTFT